MILWTKFILSNFLPAKIIIDFSVLSTIKLESKTNQLTLGHSS